MLRGAERTRYGAARAALARYLADGAKGLFVLEAPRDYCRCDAIFPFYFPVARLVWRYFVVRLALLATTPPFLKRWLLRRVGMKVGRRVCIAPGASIDHFFPRLVEIGDDCVLGEGCCILTHEISARAVRVGRVRIGEGSVVGVRAGVRCGVTVGRGATVGACSYVTKDVPEGATVMGVPASRAVPAREAERAGPGQGDCCRSGGA